MLLDHGLIKGGDISNAIVYVDKELTPENKLYLLYQYDQVLGLDLENIQKTQEDIPEEIKELAIQRQEARKNKDWTLADQLRKKIQELGYDILDTKTESKIIKQ